MTKREMGTALDTIAKYFEQIIARAEAAGVEPKDIADPQTAAVVQELIRRIETESGKASNGQAKEH